MFEFFVDSIHNIYSLLSGDTFINEILINIVCCVIAFLFVLVPFLVLRKIIDLIGG